jgi:hypothetical protein
VIRKKRKKVTLTKALSKPVQRLSPRTISATKNAIQQAKSKATLKAISRFNPSSPKQGGAVVSSRGREYTKPVLIRTRLKVGKNPKVNIMLDYGKKLKPRQVAGVRSIYRQYGRY